jgi:PhnB protein
MPVQAIPDGYATVTPSIRCRNATAALEYYAKAFGAHELFRLPMPDGSIGHAEIRIGNSIIMISDEFADWGVFGPETLKGCTGGLMIYSENCDAAVDRAIAAGGTLLRPVVDQFYGDRSGTVRDPFGHEWTISTHIEDLTPEVMKARMNEWAAKQQAG